MFLTAEFGCLVGKPSGAVMGETEMLVSVFAAEVGSEDKEYKAETELIKLKRETNAR